MLSNLQGHNFVLQSTKAAAKTTDTLIYIKLSHSILFKIFFYPVSKRKMCLSLYICTSSVIKIDSTFKEKKRLGIFLIPSKEHLYTGVRVWVGESL